MHKWHQKDLETRFNKAYAILSNAKERMQAEEGKYCIDNYIKDDVDIIKFKEAFSKYFKTEKTPDFIMQTTQRRYMIKEYNKQNTTTWIDASKETTIYTPTNLTIKLSKYQQSHMLFTVDTNGLGIKPDTLGHDIFYFYWQVDNPNKLNTYGEHYYNQDFQCSRYQESGMGCAKWALLNKCADDITKKYWECLP